MFEAILTICLLAAGTDCRDALLPGYEAATREACDMALAATPPDLIPAGHAPSGPACKPVGAALDFTEVAPGVFVHLGQIAEPDRGNRGDMSNIGFIIGQRSVAVIDTGSARWVGEAIWRAIRAHTNLPVSHVILTHMHPDHVFGASAFAGTGARIVGHATLNRALADRQENYRQSLAALLGPAFLGTASVVPDITVQDSLHIDLGSRVLDLRAWPIGHTGTDLTVLDRETAILFTGDLIFERHLPALDGSLRGWQSVLTELATLPATRIVPGHGGPVLDWPDGVAGMQRYLGVLERDTRAAIDNGQRLGDAVHDIAASEAPHWQLFEAFNPRNATVAYTELEWE